MEQTAAEYDRETTLGLTRPTYLFGHQVLEGENLEISDQAIRIPGYDQPISLKMDNPFADFDQ